MDPLTRRQGTAQKDAERELQAQCNDPARPEACVVFLQTDLIRSSGEGAALLLRVIQQPFILITGSNDDECMPYRSVPRADEENTTPHDVDDLIRSPLLIRWYGKNICLHPGHTGGKLVALPLGPKWQWRSHDFDGESKVQTKQDIVDAGSGDPRKLFLEGKKREMYVAIDKDSTNDPFYHPNRGLRERFLKRVKEGGFPKAPAPGKQFGAVEAFGVSHAEYMIHLKDAAYVLSPPGKLGCLGLPRCQACVVWRVWPLPCSSPLALCITFAFEFNE